MKLNIDKEWLKRMTEQDEGCISVGGLYTKLRLIEEGLACPYCVDWGRTTNPNESSFLIPCPECKRLTWPNAGVNIPAGSVAAEMARAQIPK